MQGQKKYLKLAAFVPAIVLVGGLVGYRAGAFERFTKSDPQPAAAPQPAPEGKRTYMPGSKFMHIEIPPLGGTSPTDATPPDAAPPSPAPNSATPGKPPTFIYSSKSGPIELPLPMLPPGGDGKPHAPNAPTPPQP
jgi:hypothetical protein